MVLSRHNIEPEDAMVTIDTFKGPLTGMRIPADDIGFATEDSVCDAVLEAMGYGEDDRPPSVSTETLQEMWERE